MQFGGACSCAKIESVFGNVRLNRRELLASAATAAASAFAKRGLGSEAYHSTGKQAVRIAIDTRRRFGAIPADFMGLGYEISSVATPGLLSAQNVVYMQLVRTLSQAGVIRIGGNTSDYSSFFPNGLAASVPKGTLVNRAALRELGTFLDATGWKLIWGLNLGSGDEQQAIEESQAVAAAVGNQLLAFEIVSVSPEAVTPAGDVLVTVKAAAKRVPATAMQWRFRYDGDLISPVSFTVTPKSAAAKKTISCTIQKEETRCILWGSNTNPIPDGDIAEVRFRLRAGSRTQKTRVTLDHPEAVSDQGEALAVAPTSSSVEVASPENSRIKSETARKESNKEVDAAAMQRRR